MNLWEDKMKKLLLVLLCFALLISATSCSFRYISSYKALGLVRNEMGDRGSAKFSRLDGTLVLKLKMNGTGLENSIGCKAILDEGEINVYYDIFGVKEFLFNLKAGESIDERRGYIESGHRVYIIIETVTPAKGSVEIDLRK